VICDFGTSIVCDDERHYGRLQTCTYRAPEIDYDRMKVLHSAKIDMWSIGCILFELASGRPAVNYVNGIEDSSWYTCNFFELYHDSRGERLKMLRKVDYKYIRKIIIKKLSHESVRAELLNKTGFVELIARCLHPNHNKRVDSKSALDYINHLINPSIGLTPNLKFSIFPSEVGIDEMDCVANVDQDIIAGCNSSGLCLADILYNRYIKICNNYDEQDVKYACIFIASCIFPGYYHVPTMIMCKLSPKKIHGIASHIMVKFRGRIL
jgi:serine/threonine protein kinase